MVERGAEDCGGCVSAGDHVDHEPGDDLVVVYGGGVGGFGFDELVEVVWG